MAISREVINLVELAVKDAVITSTERKVIVEKALTYGCSELEINQYINATLQRKLQNLSKEQLKGCPKCGGQIPLISNECPYCGNVFQLTKSSNAVSVNSEAAQIIAAENERIEEENSKRCPKCGAPYPFVSNVCSSCGNVLHRNEESSVSVSKLITKIDVSLDNLKNIKNVSFFQIFLHRAPFMVLYLSIFFFYMGGQITSNDPYNTAGGLYCLSFGLLCIAVWLIYHYIIDPSVQSPIDENNQLYYKEKNNYNQYAYELKLLYGEHPEAKQFLDSLQPKLLALDNERQRSRKFTIGGYSLLVLLSVAYLFVNNDYSSVYDQNRSTFSSQWALADAVVDIPVHYSDDTLFSMPETLRLSPVFKFNANGQCTDNSYYALTVENVPISSQGVKLQDGKKLDVAIMFYDAESASLKMESNLFLPTDTVRLRNCAEAGQGHLITDFESKGTLSADSARYFLRNAKYAMIFTFVK